MQCHIHRVLGSYRDDRAQRSEHMVQGSLTVLGQDSLAKLVGALVSCFAECGAEVIAHARYVPC